MSFVDAHDFSVGLVLRVLGIPASTYYEWRKARREPSRRAIEDAELLRLIDAIRGEHEFAASYGSPRVWLELRRRGVRVGRKRVERIMRVNGRRGAYLRRGWKHGSTRQNPNHTAAPDLLHRDFAATAPNQKWVADLTRILTGEGVLWLASMRDGWIQLVVATPRSGGVWMGRPRGWAAAATGRPAMRSPGRPPHPIAMLCEETAELMDLISAQRQFPAYGPSYWGAIAVFVIGAALLVLIGRRQTESQARRFGRTLGALTGAIYGGVLICR